MKILRNCLAEVDETDVFYWNLYGDDPYMPNFWFRPSNVQIEWYRDDPGRATFSNVEDNNLQAIAILNDVLRSIRERRTET